MTCNCCGTTDHRDNRGPVTIFTVEGLCTVCRAWFVRVVMDHNVSAKFMGVRRSLS